MASPVDSARQATNISTAGTSHAINVGSPVSGDLLVVFARFAGAPGAVTFTGYTPIVTAEASDASDDVTYVWYRAADGTEGSTDTLTTGNSIKLGAIGWVVKGARDPIVSAPAVSTVAVGTTTLNTCDPGSVNGAIGSADYLFLALGGMDGEVGAFTAAPTNYTNFQAANSGTGSTAGTNVLLGGGSRQLTASSDNPGVFTHAAANSAWTAFTVAIAPALTIDTIVVGYAQGVTPSAY